MTSSVLIVDDDRWVRRAVCGTLAEDPSLEVLEPVGTGEDAVDAFSTNPIPDLVLMDINLGPRMSGVDATARIMLTHPTAKILLLTTVAPGPGIARALDAGALAAVSKSAPEEIVLDAIHKILEGDTDTLHGALASDIVISDGIPPTPKKTAPDLTPRELEVLKYICAGYTYDSIACKMILDLSTVKTHAAHLRKKLGARTSAQLIVRALQYKFYGPD
jgi:DNA-binding NarL/FixJ family response regulator